MPHSTRELWYAFTAIVIITILYFFVAIMMGGIPPAREFFGHSLGILGFILMLMTETLYSLRKRGRSARWGRMSEWLQFHIFTGIVGPYLVLIHSSWKFNGLAGIVMLFTVVIVISGFIGRYIYTSVPRTVDGIEMQAVQIENAIRSVEEDLKTLVIQRPGIAQLMEGRMAMLMAANSGEAIRSPGPIFWKVFADTGERVRWFFEKYRLEPSLRNQADQLEGLIRKRRILERQVRSLANARRLLALWHAIHVPIGLVLFASAFVHIVAAVYYASLLR